MRVGDRVKQVDPLAIGDDGALSGPARYGTITAMLGEQFVHVRWDDGEEDAISMMLVEVLDAIEGLGSLLGGSQPPYGP